MRIPFKCDSVKLTSPYAVRTLDGTTAMHTGYDIVGIGSTAVTAVCSGRVVRSRIVTDKANPTWQWGNYVCIKTDNGQYHYYCHLASRSVSEGQNVKRGDVLGVMGSTGYSFGAHLHFEVRSSDGKTTLSPETVLGIPNAAGKYTLSQLEKDIFTLYSAGVINTPEFWEQNAAKFRYVPELISSMAQRV